MPNKTYIVRTEKILIQIFDLVYEVEAKNKQHVKDLITNGEVLPKDEAFFERFEKEKIINIKEK